MSKTAAQRQRESRQRKRDKQNVTHPADVTPEGEVLLKELFKPIPASLEQYQDHPDMYATRAEPELLNWGPWMNAPDLAKAGFKANRVTIPGDWDYAGVCEQVDGEFVVEPRPDLTSIETMSDIDLQLRIKSYPGASWVDSPEHKEIQRRKQAAGGAWT